MKNKKSAIIERFLRKGYDADAAHPAAINVISDFEYYDIVKPLVLADIKTGLTIPELELKYDLSVRQIRHLWYKISDKSR